MPPSLGLAVGRRPWRATDWRLGDRGKNSHAVTLVQCVLLDSCWRERPLCLAGFGAVETLGPAPPGTPVGVGSSARAQAQVLSPECGTAEAAHAGRRLLQQPGVSARGRGLVFLLEFEWGGCPGLLCLRLCCSEVKLWPRVPVPLPK